MDIQTVHAVWFSPTGATQRVVSHLAACLGDALAVPVREHSLNTPRDREDALSFAPTDLVVLGVPVYAGRVPNRLLPYLRDSVFGNGAPAVPVVLYGNRDFDDALIELRNGMHINGFHPIAAGAFVGQHAFSSVLAAGRPDGDDLALAADLARQTARLVQALDAAPAQPVAVDGHDPIRPYYIPRDRHGEPIRDFLKAKPVTDLSRCTRCGLCVRLCPTGAIDPRDVSCVTGTCIKCCACVKRCPRGAKSFDHEGFLYHARQLEDQYAARRAPSRTFLYRP